MWVPPPPPPPAVPTSWLPDGGLAGAAPASTGDASDRPVEFTVPVPRFGQTTAPVQGDPLLAQAPIGSPQRQALIIESAAMGATTAASHPLGNTPQTATPSTPATDTSFVERHVTTDNRMGFLQQFQQPAVTRDYNAMQFQRNAPQRPADSPDRAVPPMAVPPPVTTGGGLSMQTPSPWGNWGAVQGTPSGPDPTAGRRATEGPHAAAGGLRARDDAGPNYGAWSPTAVRPPGRVQCGRPRGRCGRQCNFEVEPKSGEHRDGVRYCLCDHCHKQAVEKSATLCCPQPLSYAPPYPGGNMMQGPEAWTQDQRMFARLRAVDNREIPEFEGNPEDVNDYMRKIEIFHGVRLLPNLKGIA